ncbi:hypothetical protein LshimejAT787_0600710 [Lyophyllum shimeji]|uniref:Uncharacterized protein n=1 Tax=Lyophyllum shimeji TaxID=47721 RepID=A0A9P3PP05_LYOSH|nr:hypothetical protein LshimejAT787_0600710 [Lyophyllum shimeji]
MRFSSVFVLASLVVSGFASTAADVQKEIATICGLLGKTNSLIVAYPTKGGTLKQALEIHDSAGVVLAAVKKGTVTANGLTVTFSHAEGRAILDALKACPVKPTLSDLVAKKLAFAALPLGGILTVFHKDLTDLGASTSDFEQVLIKWGSKDLEAEAKALAADDHNAFVAALAVYA